MRQILTFYFLLPLLVFIFSSCDTLLYSPDEENYVNIPVPKNELSIDLTNPVDTIFAYGVTSLKINYDTKGKPFSRIVFYIDSQNAGSTTNPSLCTVYTEGYSDGYHELRMEVWARSKSGSFADKLESEFLVAAKTYNMVIDNREFTGVIDIDSVYCLDGSLRISWDKYPYLNLLRYEVYKSTNNGYDYALVNIVNDRSKNYCYDSTYVGGNVRYKLCTKANGNTYYSLERSFSDTQGGILSIDVLDDTTLQIISNKAKYYRNVCQYSLMRGYDGSDYNIKKIKEWTNHNDTVLIDKPGFGAKADYYINYSGSSYLYFSSSPKKSAYLGTQHYVGELSYIPGLNSFYSISWSGGIAMKTERLDPNTFAVLAACEGTVIPSVSGALAYSNNFNGNDYIPHSFTKVNPFSLIRESPTVYTDSYLGYYSSTNSFAVSETDILFYVGLRYKNPTLYGPGANILFDAVNPAKLAKDSTVYSNDGKIFISTKTDEGEYVVPAYSYTLLNIKKPEL